MHRVPPAVMAPAAGGLVALVGALLAWPVLSVGGWPVDTAAALVASLLLGVLGALAAALRATFASADRRRPSQMAAASALPTQRPVEPASPPYVNHRDQHGVDAGMPMAPRPAQGSVSIPFGQGQWWGRTAEEPAGSRVDGGPAGIRPPVIRPASSSVVAQCPQCGTHRLRVEPGPGGLNLTCLQTHCGYPWSWHPEDPWPRTSVRPPPRPPHSAAPAPVDPPGVIDSFRATKEL